VCVSLSRASHALSHSTKEVWKLLAARARSLSPTGEVWMPLTAAGHVCVCVCVVCVCVRVCVRVRARVRVCQSRVRSALSLTLISCLDAISSGRMCVCVFV